MCSSSSTCGASRPSWIRTQPSRYGPAREAGVAVRLSVSCTESVSRDAFVYIIYLTRYNSFS